MGSLKELTALPGPAETGKLGIMYLKRYWQKHLLKRSGKIPADAFSEEWTSDITMLSAIGLGLEQTVIHLYNSAPGFEAFEDWILETTGGIDREKISEFNNYILNTENRPEGNSTPAVLQADDIDYWNENGYVIIRNAVLKEDCEKTIEVICDFIGVNRNDPSTWYSPHPARQGIMVQLFQHEMLEKNRRSAKIRAAYEQLWERKDIWVNTDRVGFNPPETVEWKFPGPGMHWDVSLQLPVPFGLQGILYLADTAANQGAFTLVPGFHHRIEKWLNSLPPGTNARNEDMHALGSVPIAANAGDFIIWHHALPHGSSPNTAALPRFVQYINYAPADAEVKQKWV